MAVVLPSQRAATYLLLSNVGFAVIVGAVWSLVLGAPTAVFATLLLIGSGLGLVSSGWVRNRSSAERDALAMLGWSPVQRSALQVFHWAMFGLFVVAAVVGLTR